MAIEWYRIDAGLKSHPKRMRVAKLTGCSKLEAMAYITLLFTFTATHAEDGGIDRFSSDEIEDACEWAGEPGRLYKAFVEAGFIDETPYGKVVHDWLERNWRHVENDRRRKQLWRESKKVKEETGTGQDGDVSGPGQGRIRPSNERTNERTNLDYLIPADRLMLAKLRFISMRSEHPVYKTKGGYAWSERDRKAANRVLYPDADTGYFPAQEELENGLRNFFASDPKWTADHSAFWFFERFNQFCAGPAVDHRGQEMGRGGSKGRPEPKLRDFGSTGPLKGKGKGFQGIDFKSGQGGHGQPQEQSSAVSQTGGKDEKV